MIVRAALAIVLVASGCDALFGLNPVPADPDARHDATLDGKLDARDVQSDASVDAPDKGNCGSIGLSCSSVALYKTTAGCYAACNDQVTYLIASARCQAWGGGLAIFDIAQKDTLLQAQMSDTATFWMGMQQATNQIDPAAGWSWNNGTAVMGARWYLDPTFGNQPDDGGSDHVENGQEQCGWYSKLGWGDGNCSGLFQYLCEK